MTPIPEIIFSGFVSKVVNDIVDVSKDKIRRAVRNKNTKHQSIESQIYNVVVDVLNKITGNRYENNQDSIYDVTEDLLKSFKKNDIDELKGVKSCLRALDLPVNENECLEFKVSLYEEFGRNEYRELFRAILLLLLDQKNRYDNGIYVQLNQKLDEVILILNKNLNTGENNSVKVRIESRTQEYADKWNENMFLNNFDKRDQNAGTNIKLSEVYLEDHLPHYIWYKNNEYDPSTDLKELLSEYVNEKRDNKMLLILGQPGIGKSTLITWITANFSEKIDDILVYRFAFDLGNIDWQNRRISNRVLEELGLNHNDLNGKTLIIDGFDEVNIESNRRRDILDSLYIDWINNKTIKNFSLIITCRENYVFQFAILKCKYIILKPWNEIQIRSFCNIFQEKTKNNVSEITIKKICKNKQILGIPLILYMVLALNISIEKEGSIVDVYDKIFALEGGIYDRCIDNKSFAEKHRIAEVKKQIHQISREIAIWMFENNSEGASISQKEYIDICDGVMRKFAIGNVEIEHDFKIGSYFKLIKHCDGVNTEELSFVHRSIYEYFVVEMIYMSICEQLDISQERLASILGKLLKKGKLSPNMLDYLKRKIIKSKLKNSFAVVNEAFQLMLKDGMTYYTNECYKNVIVCEMNIFANMLEILHLWKDVDIKFNDSIRVYLKYKVDFPLNLRDVDLCNVKLGKVNLEEVNLQNANLGGVYLGGSNLKKVNLRGADLKKAYLGQANLKEAYLEGANLSEAYIKGADFKGAWIDEEQVMYLKEECNICDLNICAEEIDEDE